MATKVNLADFGIKYTGEIDPAFIRSLRELADAIASSASDYSAVARGIRVLLSAVRDIRSQDVENLGKFTAEFKKLVDPLVGKRLVGLENLTTDIKPFVEGIRDATASIVEFGKTTDVRLSKVADSIARVTGRTLKDAFSNLKLETTQTQTSISSATKEFERFFELSKKYIALQAADRSRGSAKGLVTRLSNSGAPDEEIERAKARLAELDRYIEANQESGKDLQQQLLLLGRTLGLTRDELDGFISKGIADLRKETLAADSPIKKLGLSLESLRGAGKGLSESFPTTALDKMADSLTLITKQLSLLSLGVIKTWGDLPAALGDDGQAILRSMLGPFEKAYDILVGNSIVPDLKDEILDLMGNELPKSLERSHVRVEDAIVEPFAKAYDVLVGNSIIPDLVKESVDQLGNVFVQDIRREHGDMVAAMVAPFAKGATSVQDILDRTLAAQEDRVIRLSRLVQKANSDIANNAPTSINIDAAKSRLAVEEARFRAIQAARQRTRNDDLPTQRLAGFAADTTQRLDVSINADSISEAKQKLAAINVELQTLKDQASQGIASNVGTSIALLESQRKAILSDVAVVRSIAEDEALAITFQIRALTAASDQMAEAGVKLRADLDQVERDYKEYVAAFDQVKSRKMKAGAEVFALDQQYGTVAQPIQGITDPGQLAAAQAAQQQQLAFLDTQRETARKENDAAYAQLRQFELNSERVIGEFEKKVIELNQAILRNSEDLVTYNAPLKKQVETLQEALKIQQQIIDTPALANEIKGTAKSVTDEIAEAYRREQQELAEFIADSSVSSFTKALRKGVSVLTSSANGITSLVNSVKNIGGITDIFGAKSYFGLIDVDRGGQQSELVTEATKQLAQKQAERLAQEQRYTAEIEKLYSQRERLIDAAIADASKSEIDAINKQAAVLQEKRKNLVEMRADLYHNPAQTPDITNQIDQYQKEIALVDSQLTKLEESRTNQLGKIRNTVIRSIKEQLDTVDSEIKNAQRELGRVQDSSNRLTSISEIGADRDVRQFAARDETGLFSLTDPSRIKSALTLLQSGAGVFRSIERLAYGANEATSAFGVSLGKATKFFFDLQNDAAMDGPLIGFAEQLAQVSQKSGNLFEQVEQQVRQVNQKLKTEGLDLINIDTFRNSRRIVEREMGNIVTNIQAGGKVSDETLSNALFEIEKLTALTEELRAQASVNPFAAQLVAEVEKQIAVQRKLVEDITLVNRAQKEKEEQDQRTVRSERSLLDILKSLMGNLTLLPGLFAKSITGVANFGGGILRAINPLNRLSESLLQIRNVALGVFGGNLLTRVFDYFTENLGSGAKSTTATIDDFSISLQTRLTEQNNVMRTLLAKDGIFGDEAEALIKERANTVTTNVLDFIKKFTADTKFELADTIDGFNRLLGAKLDPTKWLEPIANVATAMTKPVNQVVDAITTLSTGDKGEAVQRLRDLGISVEDLGFKFSKSGELLTPVPEALDKIYDRFKNAPEFAGQATAGASTLMGSLSTLGDTLKNLGNEVLSPVFDSLKNGVTDLANVLDGAGLRTSLQDLGVGFATLLTKAQATFKAIAESSFAQKAMLGLKIIGMAIVEIFDAIKYRVGTVINFFKQAGQSGTTMRALVIALFSVRELLLSIADLIRGDFGQAFGRLKGVVELAGLAIAGVFVDMVPKAFGWASNIVTSFAQGFATTGASVITQALNSFTSIIAYFLEGFSPPKGEPLNQIDTWGSNLAATFADSIGEYDPSEQVQTLGSRIADAVKGFDLGDFDLADSLFGTVQKNIEVGVKLAGGKDADIAAQLENARMQAIEVVQQLKAGGDAQQLAEQYVNDVLGGVVAPTQELIEKIAADLAVIGQNKVIADLETSIADLEATRDAQIDVLEQDLTAYEKSIDGALEAAEGVLGNLQEQAERQQEALGEYNTATEAIVEKSIKAAGLFVSESEQAKVDAALNAASKEVKDAEDRLDTIREKNAKRGLTIKTFEELNAEASLELAKQKEKEAQAEVDAVEARKAKADELERKIRGQRESGAAALQAAIEATQADIEQQQQALDNQRSVADAEKERRQGVIDALRESYDQQIKVSEEQKLIAEQEAKRLAEIAALRAKAIELQLDAAKAELDSREKEKASKAKAGDPTNAVVGKIDVPKFLIDKFGDPVALDELKKATEGDLNAILNIAIDKVRSDLREKLKGFWNGIVDFLNNSELGQAIRAGIGIALRILIGLLARFVALKVVAAFKDLIALILGLINALKLLGGVNPLVIGLAAAITGLILLYVKNREAFNSIVAFFVDISKVIQAIAIGIFEKFVRVFDAFARTADGAISPLKALATTLGIGAIAFAKFATAAQIQKVVSVLQTFFGLSIGAAPLIGIIIGVSVALVALSDKSNGLADALTDLVISFQPLFEAVGRILLVLGQLALAFAPVITILAALTAGLLTVIAVPILTFLAKIASTIVSLVLKPLQLLLEAVQSNAVVVNTLAVALAAVLVVIAGSKIAAGFSLLIGFIVNFNAIIATMIVGLQGSTVGLVGFGAAAKAALLSTTGLVGIIAAVAAGLGYLTIQLLGGNQAFKDGIATMLDFIGVTGMMDEKFAAVNNSSRSVSRALEQIAKSTKAIDGNITFDVDAKSLDRFNGAMLEIEAKIEARKQKVRELYEAYNDDAPKEVTDRIIKEARALDSEINGLTKEVQDAEKALVEQSKALRKVQENAFAANLTFDEYNRKLSPNYQTQTGKAAKQLSLFNKVVEDARRVQYDAEKANYQNARSVEKLAQAYRSERDNLSKFLSESEQADAEYKQAIIDSEAEYNEELATLQNERRNAATVEEQQAIDERITALQQSYTDEKADRDKAYEQEKIDRKKRLAELLIDTITAGVERRIAQGGLDDEQIAQLRETLAKQTEQIALANGIIDTNMTNLANRAIVEYDRWTTQGGEDINDFLVILQDLGYDVDTVKEKVGSFGKTPLNVAYNKEQMEEAQKRLETLYTMLEKLNGKEVSVRVLVDTITGANQGGGRVPPPKNTTVPGFAGGTGSAPGGWALVGEQGTELVFLPKGSKVFNKAQTNDFLRSRDRFDDVQRRYNPELGRLEKSPAEQLRKAIDLFKRLADQGNKIALDNQQVTRSIMPVVNQRLYNVPNLGVIQRGRIVSGNESTNKSIMPVRGNNNYGDIHLMLPPGTNNPKRFAHDFMSEVDRLEQERNRR